MEEKPTLNQIINARLERSGLSQAAIARATGISQSSVSRKLSGLSPWTPCERLVLDMMLQSIERQDAAEMREER